MRVTKLSLLGLLVVGIALVSSPRASHAAACADNFATIIDTAGSCTLNGGATTFDITSISGMPAGLAVLFTASGGSFTISFVKVGGFLTVPFTSSDDNGSIQYTLSGGLSGAFNAVRLDSNQLAAGTSVTKRVVGTGLDFTLQSVSGSQDIGNYQNINFLTITDTIVISANGQMSTFSNEFFHIPAPGALAIFSVGLMGLGWSRRRRGA